MTTPRFAALDYISELASGKRKHCLDSSHSRGAAKKQSKLLTWLPRNSFAQSDQTLYALVLKQTYTGKIVLT